MPNNWHQPKAAIARPSRHVLRLGTVDRASDLGLSSGWPLLCCAPERIRTPNLLKASRFRNRDFRIVAPIVTTQAQTDVPVGEPIRDTAVVAGRVPAETGLYFELYEATRAETCEWVTDYPEGFEPSTEPGANNLTGVCEEADPVFTTEESIHVTAEGEFTSASFVPEEFGKYLWVETLTTIPEEGEEVLTIVGYQTPDTSPVTEACTAETQVFEWTSEPLPGGIAENLEIDSDKFAPKNLGTDSKAYFIETTKGALGRTVSIGECGEPDETLSVEGDGVIAWTGGDSAPALWVSSLALLTLFAASGLAMSRRGVNVYPQEDRPRRRSYAGADLMSNEVISRSSCQAAGHLMRTVSPVRETCHQN